MLLSSIAPLLLAVVPPVGSRPAAPGQDGAAQAEEAAPVPAELASAAQAIESDVAKLRGLAFEKPVTLRVTTKADLEAFLRAHLDDHTTPDRRQAEEETAKLLGLLPADADLTAIEMSLIESQVGGFYDPETKTFSLMQSLVGGGVAKVILAHELTHALDDQHYDLEKAMTAREDDSDRAWAFQAVTEGSATLVMNRWALAHMSELSAADMEAVQDMGQEELAESPAFLWEPLVGAYMRGAAFLARTEHVMQGLMSAPKAEDLARAFQDPPASSEQVLHPEKYWGPGPPDLPVQVDLGPEDLPDGWDVVAEDTFGELGLALIVAPLDARGGPEDPAAVLAVQYTGPATEGWGGDRWVLLEKGPARRFVLETVWDTPADAQEFADALGPVHDHIDDAARDLASRLAAQAGDGTPPDAEPSHSVTVTHEGSRVRLEVRAG